MGLWISNQGHPDLPKDLGIVINKLMDGNPRQGISIFPNSFQEKLTSRGPNRAQNIPKVVRTSHLFGGSCFLEPVEITLRTALNVASQSATYHIKFSSEAHMYEVKVT